MDNISKRDNAPKSETMYYWKLMTVYERFEQVVALVLSGIISLIIIAALFHLVKQIFNLMFMDIFNPFDHRVFQTIFGMIMTLLISMEFKHSIVKVIYRKDHIIQVKTVLLIALLAISRKFIILDISVTDAMHIFALGFSVLVLAAAYWGIKQRDAESEK